MGEHSTIEWTGSTWNFIRGCSRTAARGAKTSGCGDATGGGCYAEYDGGRFCGQGGTFDGLVKITKGGERRWTGVVRLIPARITLPLRWQDPRKIFVASYSDPFHEKIDYEVNAAMYGIMVLARRHTFQVLTKRARRMKLWHLWIAEHARKVGTTIARACVEFALDLVRQVFPKHEKMIERAIARWTKDLTSSSYTAWPLPNVWHGVSVEHQLAADDRVPELLDTPSVVRFVSCEPLIGPVDLRRVRRENGPVAIDALTGRWSVPQNFAPSIRGDGQEPRLHWVIAGAESGRRARECDSAWLESLRDQCADTGTAFFLKQAEEVRQAVPAPASAPAEMVTSDVSGRWVDVVQAGPGSKPKKRRPGGLRIVGRPYLRGIVHEEFPRSSTSETVS